MRRTQTNAKNDLGIISETPSNMHEIRSSKSFKLSGYTCLESGPTVCTFLYTYYLNSEVNGVGPDSRQVPLCGPFSRGIAGLSCHLTAVSLAADGIMYHRNGYLTINETVMIV